jgi:hypothetical protein
MVKGTLSFFRGLVPWPFGCENFQRYSGKQEDRPMAKEETTSASGKNSFTVEIGEIELSEEELKGLGNEITRLAIESLRSKAAASGRILREPYVKIIFVKAGHVKSVRM